MAVAVRTVTALNFGTGQNPASQNITTTSGDKGVAVFFSGYTDGTGGFGVSATLNGVAPSHFVEFQGTFDEVGTCAFVWLAPAIGTLALDPVFDVGPITDGPACLAAMLTATNDISVIGSDCDSVIGSGTASATATSATGDFALAMAQNYTAAPTIGGTGAANVSGGSQTANGELVQLFTVTAGASTSTATSNGATYPTVALVVLRDSSGGGGGSFGPRRSLLGVGRRKPDLPSWHRKPGSRLYSMAA